MAEYPKARKQNWQKARTAIQIILAVALSAAVFIFVASFWHSLTQAAATNIDVKSGVSGATTAAAGQRKIARAQNGDLYCVYVRSDDTYNQVYIAKSADNGATWTELSTVHATVSAAQAAPSIAIDVSNNLYVVWSGKGWGTNAANDNIQYRKGSAGTSITWSDQEAVTDVAYDQNNPVVGIDSVNNLHVVWTGKTGTGTYPDIYNIQYRKRASSWQTQEEVTAVAYDQNSPCLAIDSSNNLHVVWLAKTATYPDIYNLQYRKRTSSWQTQEEVTAVAYDQNSPCLAIDSSNNLHVIWTGKTGTYPDIYNIQYRKRASSWQTQEEVTTKSILGEDQGEPSVALDSSGVVYALWQGKGWGTNTANNNIQYSRRASASTDWLNNRAPITDLALEQTNPVLLWSIRPVVFTDVNTNIITSGYSFIWTSAGTAVKFYASNGIIWPKVYFVLSPSTSTPFAGTSTDVTITATKKDANNQGITVTGYSVASTVSVSATGAATFNSPSSGNPISSNFSNGVATVGLTDKTAEDVTVTATDQTNPSITGTSPTIAFNPAIASKFTLSVSNFTAGAWSSSYTVYLRDTYNNNVSAGTGGVTVSLSSSSTGANKKFSLSSEGSAIPQITIPEGSSMASFYYYDEKAGTWTITASATGLTSGTGNITVSPATASKIVFTSSAKTLTAGIISDAYSVEIRDAYDNLRTADALALTLKSSSAQGKFDTSSGGAFNGTVTSITTAAGKGTFYYKDTFAGNPFITVSCTGLTSATQTQTVKPGPIDHYTITATTPKADGAGWSETVTAKDASNNTVITDSSTSLAMTTSSASAKFYTDRTYASETSNYTLSSGVTVIYIRDSVGETLTLTATDANNKSGTSAPITVYTPESITKTSGGKAWQGPIVWSNDGKGDYNFIGNGTLSSGVRVDNDGKVICSSDSGIYELITPITALGKSISAIFAKWDATGIVTLKVSADNGITYADINNGAVLTSDFGSGNSLRWQATFANNSTLSNLSLKYMDSSGNYYPFDEMGAMLNSVQVKPNGDIEVSSKYTISGNEIFKYRRKIIIDNTNGALQLNNYQVRLDLSAANFDFSQAKTDGRDIRITDSDGLTKRNYWIKSWDAFNKSAKVWVKVPIIPASSTATIYLYYGGTPNTSESNGWVFAESAATGPTVTVMPPERKTYAISGTYTSNSLSSTNDLVSLSLGGILEEEAMYFGEYGTTETDNFKSINKYSSGYYHTCVVMDDGTVRCWGNNSKGQLGNGTTTNSSTPVVVTGIGNAVSVAAGGNHSCALLKDGTIKCWGANTSGQLGKGNADAGSLTPVPVNNITNAVQISAGAMHNCALLNNGTVRCWGCNSAGQLGIAGNTTTVITAPSGYSDTTLAVKTTSAILTDVTSVSCGRGHCLALLSNGGVKSWGSNIAVGIPGPETQTLGVNTAINVLGPIGNTGVTTTTQASGPVDVTGLTSGVAGIAAGYIHSCALLSTGAVRCWGYNAYGQVGDGSTTTRATPVALSPAINNALAIAAAGHHSLAVLSDGTVKAWGYNNYGQLGDTTITNRSSPLNVKNADGTTVNNAQDVSAGFYHSALFLNNKNIKSFGLNSSGQLGDKSFTNRSSAVAFVSGSYNTVALYHFEGRANDATSNALNGALIGDGSYETSGNFGKVLHLDGSSGYISVAYNNAFNLTNKFTLEAWIKPDAPPGADEYIFYRHQAYYLKIDSNAKLVGGVWNSASSSWRTVTSSSSLTTDGTTWTHVAFVFDKDAPTKQTFLFINGTQDAAGTFSSSIPQQATAGFYIGCQYTDAASNFFDGSIDEARISGVSRGFLKAGISLDGGNNWLNNIILGKVYTSAGGDFTAGKNFKYKLDFAALDTYVSPKIKQVALTYGASPIVNASNITLKYKKAGKASWNTYDSSTNYTLKIGDSLRVSWNNSPNADGQYNSEANISSCSWQFGNWAAVTMANTSDVWTGDYVISAGTFEGTAQVSVTAANSYGSTTQQDEVYLSADNKKPVFSSTAPASSAIVNDTKVSYALSEALQSGTITWTRTSGRADGNSPHAQSLASSELSQAAYSNITLTNNPILVDGAIYTVTFAGTDLADNTATAVENTNVKYDTTPLIISNTAPASNSFVNTSKVSYTFSETAKSGSITWTRTAGSQDSDSLHQHTLSGTELDSGSHTNITFSDISLVSAAVYTVTFAATDLADNVSTGVSNTNVTFDLTAPTVAVNIASGNYNSSTWNNSETIKGTAADSNGIIGVEISIKREDADTDHYWNGTNWDATSEQWLAVTSGTTSWKYTLNKTNLTSGRMYVVRARATDTAGNLTPEGNYASDIFTYVPIMEVSGISTSLTAGTAKDVTVKIMDYLGNLVTGYSGTAHFTSSDSQAILPSDYTFSVADAGTHTFTGGVTLKTAGVQSVTATDVSDNALTATQSSITVKHAAADHLKFSINILSPQTAGIAFELGGLEALDLYGNLVDGTGSTAAYAGIKTITYTLSGTAHAPDGNQNDSYTTSLTFSAGRSTTALTTILYRAQNTSITATASDLGGTNIASNTFTVQPGPVAKLAFYQQPSTTSYTNVALTQQPKVSVADQFGNPCNNVSDQITLTASTTSGIYTPATNGTLSGDALTVVTSAGVAIFGGIKYSYPEAIYLSATSETGLAPAIYSYQIIFRTSIDTAFAAGALEEPATISSAAYRVEDKVQVFDFKLTDAGSDGYATQIKQVIIKRNSVTDTTGGWTDYIAGAYLYDGKTTVTGTIINDVLTFGSGTTTIFSVSDGQNKTYILSIYLKPLLPQGADGKVISFKIDPNDDITLAFPGSAFAAANPLLSSLTVDVIAVKFMVTGSATAASEGIVSAGVASEVYIKATDINTNIDLGYEGDKMLVFSGANPAPSGDKPTCTNYSDVAIAFGQQTPVTFIKGKTRETTAGSNYPISLVLYKAEAIAIKATTGNITTSDSDDLELIVKGGVAGKLSWGTQPATKAVANAPWKLFTIDVADKYGNVTTASVAITVTPSGGSWSSGSTYTVNAEAGTATFRNFAVSCPSYPGIVTLKATAPGVTGTDSSNAVSVAEKYNITLKTLDSINANSLSELTIKMYNAATGLLVSGTTNPLVGNSPFNFSLPYGKYNFNLSKEAYVETTATKTADVAADALDGMYDNEINWTIYVMSIVESLSDYKVLSEFVYDEDADKITAIMRLEKRGQQVVSDEINTLKTGTLKIYDSLDVSKELYSSSATPDSLGFYLFTIDKAVASGKFVSGKSYVAKLAIQFGGEDISKNITYGALNTFTISISKRLKQITDQIATLSTQISTSSAQIADKVTAQITPTLENVSKESARILTAAETTLPTKITAMQQEVVGSIKPFVQSGILNRETAVKVGSTVTISYRTASGLGPTIDVYDPKNVLRISKGKMKEVGTTGVYVHDVTFLSAWGIGDYAIICSESTQGTADALTITVQRQDIETVAGQVSAVLGTTTGITGLRNVADAMNTQFSLLETALTKISKDIVNKVTEATAAAGDLEALYNQLVNISAQIKKLGATEGLNLEKIYEVSKDKKADLTYLKNKTQELKAAMELSQKMIENVAKKPVVQTWYEFR